MWKVTRARLSADGKSVTLTIPQLRPVMQLHLRYDLDAADSVGMRSELFASIHKQPK